MASLRMGDMCKLNSFIRTSLANHDEIGVLVDKRRDISSARIMTYWVLFYDKIRGPFFENELEVIRNKNEDKDNRVKTLNS
jgi:hypothetical protein